MGEGVEEYELKIKVNSQNWFEIQSGERWGERLNQSETIDDQAVGPKWELKAAEFAGLSTLTDTKDRHKWGTERLEEVGLISTKEILTDTNMILCNYLKIFPRFPTL